MQGLISILFENPILFVVITIALLFSITIHEFSHAYVAYKLGDSTAKSLGRMSVNPLVHLDPLGAITMLLVGFGWGKPVPVNYYNFRNPKRDAALVSFAGPGSNFILAIIMTLLLRALSMLFGSPTTAESSFPLLLAASFIYPIILYNIYLGIFNLLPIEPLDGFKIVNGILPARLAVQWVQLAPYGIYILLVLIVTNGFSRIVSPLVQVFLRVLGF